MEEEGSPIMVDRELSGVHVRRGSMTNIVAVDLGASRGRIFLAAFDGMRLEVVPVHRFANEPVRVAGTLYWDVLRLFRDLVAGLRRAKDLASGPIASIGVDGWGVDFALLDGEGRLVGMPVHYRDRRTIGMRDVAERLVPRESQYRRTGVAPMSINTLCQLLALRGSAQLAAAERLLFIPDLMHSWLSGARTSERSIASTSQLLNVHTADWDAELMAAFGLPPAIVPDLVAAGTIIGDVTDEVRDATGLPRVKVIAPAAHDTAAAVVGMPCASDVGMGWVSSGTWSVVGQVLPTPVTSDVALAAALSNERAADGRIRLSRNVMGLWLLQECLRRWGEEGLDVNDAQLVAEAERGSTDGPLVDPDDAAFVEPGDMPSRIAHACARTGQAPPLTQRDVARCILESLAAKTRWSLDRCARASGVEPTRIHVAGGGAQNRLLTQLIADISGRPVDAGPVEAAVVGNATTQLLGLGELADWDDAWQLVRESTTVSHFEPAADRGRWDARYWMFEQLLDGGRIAKPTARATIIEERA